MIQLRKLSGLPAQSLTRFAAASVVFANLPTHSASTQSVDRDRPTPITSNEIHGSAQEFDLSRVRRVLVNP